MANRFRKAHGGARGLGSSSRRDTNPQVFVVHPRRKSGSWPTTTRASPAWASNVSSANHVWRHDHLPRPRPWPAGGSKRTAVTFLLCSLVEIRWAYTDCPRKRSLGMAVSTTSRHRKRRSTASLLGTLRPSIAMLSNSAIRRLASREPTGMSAVMGTATPDPSNPPSRRHVPSGRRTPSGSEQRARSLSPAIRTLPTCRSRRT